MSVVRYKERQAITPGVTKSNHMKKTFGKLKKKVVNGDKVDLFYTWGDLTIIIESNQHNSWSRASINGNDWKNVESAFHIGDVAKILGINHLKREFESSTLPVA